MSAADEFPLPPGDPGALKAAGGALQDVSTDLSAHGHPDRPRAGRHGRRLAGRRRHRRRHRDQHPGHDHHRQGRPGRRRRERAVRLRHRAGDRGRGGHRDPPAGRPGRGRRPLRGGPVRPGPLVRRPAGDLHQHPVAGAGPAADALPLGDRDARPGRGHRRRPAHRRGAGIPLGHDAGPALPRRPGRGGAAAAERAASRTGRTGPATWRPSCSRCWSRASRSRPRCWPSWRRTRTTPGSPRPCWRRSARRRPTGRCW